MAVTTLLPVYKQWGFTVFDPAYYKNVNFTLPLSVNGTFCAFSTGYDAKGSTFLWHSMSHFNNVNVGVTGFVFDSRYTFTGLGYLAVCWQKQWGINTGGAVRTSTLPIPFTNVFLAVASTSSEWCCPGCSATNTTVTTRAYQSNRPDVAQPNDVNWIIIGCQPQWGYQTVHGTNPVTYDLPIPFEEAPFTVAISTGNSGNHASCGGFTKTTIVLRAGTTAGVWDTVGFFIIGCQLQWGYAGGSRGTFPIAFGQFFSMASVLNNAIEAWERACYNITNTSFQINYGGPILYLAIGKA